MKRPRQDHTKTVLIVLWAAAFALGILTMFVVFMPTGSYRPVIIRGNGSSNTAPTSTVSTSTANSTAGNASGSFSSEYSFPYPVTWNEGTNQFSVIGASYTNGQLTLSLAIKMGPLSNCVPVNVRLIADESGTLRAPSSPAAPAFTFPDTQSCNGTPGATYSEPLIFSIDPTMPSPYFFTSGGSSNVFFNVATNTTNGVDVSLPSHSG